MTADDHVPARLAPATVARMQTSIVAGPPSLSVGIPVATDTAPQADTQPSVVKFTFRWVCFPEMPPVMKNNACGISP